MGVEDAPPAEIPDYLLKAMPPAARTLFVEAGAEALTQKAKRDPDGPLLVNEDGRTVCLICGRPFILENGREMHPPANRKEAKRHLKAAEQLARAVEKATRR